MSIAFKIIKRILVAILALVIGTVFGILLWRILSSGTPEPIKRLSVNDALYEAYCESGDELYMFKQEQRSITSSNENYGYFSIPEYLIIPEANQIQATVRYNNSTLRRTAEDFGLDEVPSREEEVYDVTLLLAIDLTPENEEDNLGNDEESVQFVRCHGSVTLSEQKNLYNFRKIVFDLDTADIELDSLLDSGLLLAIYADFYYVGEADYDTTPYGVLCLYDFKSKDIPVELEKKDVKALKEFGE